ncbi:MAG: hypothetical protein NTY81_02915 [Candidatus Staskawiczbacteria bacterium]|nr:hypothetical protein [Candidatus Staskawiczbacteria bacterium]
MIILNIVNFLIAGFLGYLVGRFSDNYVNIWIGDPKWIPHHWITGLLIAIIGIFFFQNNLQIWIFSFGAGVFVSDLKDFLNLKFFASDGKTKENRKFWHID